MINTFFSLNSLNSTSGLLTALWIGFLFGFILERAGFSSSRKLSGIFYFKDMTVLKVMFTAIIVAMILLGYAMNFNWITKDNLFFLPTAYQAQLIGGLIFGIGFVMGGWCPGTAASGLGAGKTDALIFLTGAGAGSLLFNEWLILFPDSQCSSEKPVFIYDLLNMSRPMFSLIFTFIGIGCFYFSEWVENRNNLEKIWYKNSVLAGISVFLIFCCIGLFISSPAEANITVMKENSGISSLMNSIQNAEDHISPEALAELIIHNSKELLLIDIRPAEDFQKFHLRGAVNCEMSLLSSFLKTQNPNLKIVLYSNGMTHPAQARDLLVLQGVKNLYILTDGINGFLEECLKPASLRPYPVGQEKHQKINQYRQYFLGTEKQEVSSQLKTGNPELIEVQWLEKNYLNSNIKILDLREQAEYNSSHIPNSISFSLQSLRSTVNGIPSSLLPGENLTALFSLAGINQNDTVVIVPNENIRDATLVGVALLKTGFWNFKILNGGFETWLKEKLPLTTKIPRFSSGDFTLGKSLLPEMNSTEIYEKIKEKNIFILDVRPEDYFNGQKQDEARKGHIPGAVNRNYKRDLDSSEKGIVKINQEKIQSEYNDLSKSRGNSPVVIHCRTGHQASQTWFIAKYLMNWKDVYYYDGGWTDWAENLSLPVE